MFFRGLSPKSLTVNNLKLTDDVAALVQWEFLVSLTSIDLRRCSLTSIPIGLAKLDPSVVTSLRLEGNPFTGYHRSLVEDMTSAHDILVILRESLEGGEVEMREMKVMVVGEPAVGKTTMLRVLYGQSGSDVAAHPCVATDGIDLGEVTIEGYRLMMWDFAGQEVYRYTHQLFLSDDSLCLILYRLTTPEEQVAPQLTYWVDSVLQRAPNAACLLIGTCAHHYEESVSAARVSAHLKFLRERYGQRIIGATAIDSLHNVGIGALKKLLVDAATKKVII